MMNTIWQFMAAHQVICTAVVTAAWVSFVAALPAPQATSSSFYQFFFKFINGLFLQFSRMNAAVEKSPNFQGAVDTQTKLAGQPSIVVRTVPPAPPQP